MGAPFPEARPIDLRRLATVDRWWRLVAVSSLAVAVAWSVAFFSARNPNQFNPKASTPWTAVEALSAWDGEPYTASLVLMHSYLPAGGSGRYEVVLFPVFFALATTRLAKSRAWIPLAITFGVFWVVCLYRFTTWR
ncbi:MAG: hypothetical protein WKF55_13165 [Gemmatimonadaceae bacterium]